jgi:hypothetical protein
LTARVEALEQGGEGESAGTTTTTVPTFIVDHGIANFSNVQANKTATMNVTFAKTFTEAPVVAAIKVFRNGPNTFYSLVAAQPVESSITTTGFTLAVGNRYTQAVSPSVLWIAFQPTEIEINTEIIIPSGDGMTEAEVRELLAPISAALNGIKTGYDGTVYDTPGEAVREQINDLHVLIGDTPGTAIQASAVAYNNSNVAAELDGVNGRLQQVNEDLNDISDGVANIEYIDLLAVQTSGYYIAAGGTVTASGTSYFVTQMIDVSAYAVIKVTASANWGHLLYAFYDENENFVSGPKSNRVETRTQIENELVRVPEGVKYIILSNAYNVILSKVYGQSITVKGLSELENALDAVTGTETYSIEFVESPTWSAGYINKSGSISEGGTSYVYSTKIPVKQGDIIKTINTISGNVNGMRYVTAYNASGVAVFASGVESANTYTVPEGIASIAISISYNATPATTYAVHHIQSVTDDVLDSANKSDVLFAKKWCVVGDSFTFGGQSVMPVFDSGRYKGARKSYPYFIGNRTHINIVDFSANGKTLAYPSDGSFANSFTNLSSDYSYQNIPADVDYITIYLGINDSHHASGSSGSDGEDVTGVIPIGTVEDTTTATFGGAWNVVLSWLIANRPNAHIGIIVSNGVENVNYRDMTIAIAKKYGVAYIDLNGDERTPAMIRSVNPDIAAAVKTMLINKWAVDPSTNTHPNTDAHEYESYFIENFLRSI